MNDQQPPTLRRCCVHVRHKLMYVDERYGTPGHVDDSCDTTVFFCVKTQDALGPDGKPVSPRACSQGRSCYCE